MESHNTEKGGSRVIRDAYGITFSTSFIFDRILNVGSTLCWASGELGLRRVHFLDGRRFYSRKEAERFADENGLKRHEIEYFHDWVDELKCMDGGERDAYLVNEYLPRRERVVNNLVDTVLQAFPADTARTFETLLGGSFPDLEYINCQTLNGVRSYSGQPDTVLIDRTAKRLVLIEIKIVKSKHRYSLDQHLKYLCFQNLSGMPELFPGYSVQCLVLGPESDFSANTMGDIRRLDPYRETSGRILLKDLAKADVSEFKPTNCNSVGELITARVEHLTAKRPSSPDTERLNLWFYPWGDFYRAIPPGRMKETIAAMKDSLG